MQCQRVTIADIGDSLPSKLLIDGPENKRECLQSTWSAMVVTMNCTPSFTVMENISPPKLAPRLARKLINRLKARRKNGFVGS